MKIGWRGVVGILLSAGFLYFAFRGIRFDEVIDADARHERRAHARSPRCSRPACSRCARSAGARSSIPSRRSCPFGKLWRATAIGMMINNVVPARAGEIARAFALSRSAPEVPLRRVARVARRRSAARRDRDLRPDVRRDARPRVPAGRADQRPAGGELRDLRRDRHADRARGDVRSSSCSRRACSRSRTLVTRRLAPKLAAKGREALVVAEPAG